MGKLRWVRIGARQATHVGKAITDSLQEVPRRVLADVPRRGRNRYSDIVEIIRPLVCVRRRVAKDDPNAYTDAEEDGDDR